MGNGESTTRMIAMQRNDDLTLVITKDVDDRLRGNRNPKIGLGEGEMVVHEKDMEQTWEEGYREGLKNLRGKVDQLKVDLKNNENSWRKLLQEGDKARENMQHELMEEHTLKMHKLEEKLKQSVEEAKKNAALADEKNRDVVEVEKKYKEMLVEQLQHETESLRLLHEQQIAERILSVEEEWKSKLQEAEEKSLRERAEMSKEMEERLRSSAETVTVELGDALNVRLQEEKGLLRLQLEQEMQEKLEEAEAVWKVTLQDAEEKARKEIMSIEMETEDKLKRELISMEAEDAINLKIEAIENEKKMLLAQIEEEGRTQLKEVEIKWQEIIREATGRAVHISSADDLKSVIDEIETSWAVKVEQKERDHDVVIKEMADSHSIQKSQADEKITEQEIRVNVMLEKLHALESREEDVRKQYTISAEKVESQLRPLRQHEVCVKPRDVALDCYNEHTSQPLRCSEAVKKFMECVDTERIALLQKGRGIA